jgi:hypothetical protein
VKAEDFGLPVNEPVDIGSGTTITLNEYDGEIVGLTEGHTDQNGNPCFGFVAFKHTRWVDNANRPQWTIESAKPLTLTPSILCRTCGKHGYIREGKWVNA